MAQPHTNSSPATSSNPTGSGASHVGARQPLFVDTNSQPDTSFASRRLSTEEEQLARAIANSLRDQTLETRGGPTNRSRQAQSATNQSIELILSLNNAFDALDDPEGDTAIYIGVPSQEPDQTHSEYQYVQNHFNRVHVVKSETLRLMGEESKFTDQDLLNPTKSYRAERRLRKDYLSAFEEAEKKRGVGFRFRYYIDLRPPHADEEAVILLTDLTCTRGVLTWHLAMEKYGLSPLAVLGHDEYGTQLRLQAGPHGSDAFTVTDDRTNVSNATDSDSYRKSSIKVPTSPQPQPPPKIAADYTRLRHHGALERLLQAIKGNDPKLDSAPKVWTFFAIARYFGCAAHERISGWITTWLYTDKNANFVQNNPEIAYRIAMGIRSPDLLKDSFSILVGERALIEAYGEYRSEILNPLRQNVHGRKLELLDDDERNRVDHAASSLVKRIREVTSSMCREMDFLHKCPTYQALEAIVGENPDEIHLLKSAKKTIKEYVRSRIYYVLCQEQNPMDCHEKDLLSTLPFRSAISNDSFSNVYMTLNQPMRLFTSTFWVALQQTQFDTGNSNLDNYGTIGNRHDTQYIQGLKALYKDDPTNGITRILRSTLNEKIGAVSRMLYERNVAKGKWKEHFEEYPCEMSLSESNEMMRHEPTNGTLEPDEFNSPANGPWFPPQPNPESGLTTGNPTRSSLSRSAEEDYSPTKRRKTSGADEFADPSHEAGGLATSPITAKTVSFASPDALEQASPDDIVRAGDKIPTSAVRGRAPLLDQASAFQQSSYGNPTSIKPSWKSGEWVSSLQQGKKAPTLALARHALALRPKLTEIDVYRSPQSDVGNGQVQKQQPAASAGASAYPNLDAGALDSSGSVLEQLATAKDKPLGEADEVTEDHAHQSSGWYSSPQKFFNPWTGKWDIWGRNTDHENRVKTQADPITPTAQKPLQFASGYSTRVVKQAFSNSNTPGQGHGNWASKDASANVSAGFANNDHHPINAGNMLPEITLAIGNICSGVLYPPHLFHQTGLLPTDLFDNLLCLNENEWRYLPLWCPDGNDDGTGGVFDETPVPNLDPASANIESFGPGRIRRGYQEADSVMSGSDIEEINSSQAISTVGKASKLATDGTHTVTSLSSAASVIDGAGDADTVIVDSPEDTLSMIHVGEDARGVNSDAEHTMSNLEKELDFEDFQDDEEDTDTINGDGPLEKEMSASLQAFIAGAGDHNVAHENENEGKGTSSFDFKQARRATRDLLDNDEDGDTVLLPDTVRGDEAKEKGKAKAQNFPHGVSDPGLARERLDLPFRGGSAQSAPTSQFLTAPERKALLEGDDDEDEDEDYEFL